MTKDELIEAIKGMNVVELADVVKACLLYTSPSPRD